MKKVIIVHAWESGPEEHWYKKEKELLKKLGYEVILPKLPGGRWPKLDEWLEVISSFAVDKDTVFIGHSLGPAAIYRYLLRSNQKIKKVISIAGFVRDLGIEETKNFVEDSFDWGKLNELIGESIVIAQTDDPYISLDVAKEVAERTRGKFILVDGNNHFDKMDLDLINKNL